MTLLHLRLAADDASYSGKREAHIKWSSMVTCKKSITRYWNYLEDYSTGPLIRNTYFEQGLSLIAPADASVISYFTISYC